MPDGSLNSIGRTEVDLSKVETNEKVGFFAGMREKLTGLFVKDESVKRVPRTAGQMAAESHARNMARRRRDSARETSLTGDILAADEYRT